MEEISWGQRIFDIDTPEALKEVNVQKEINIHNLVFFQRRRHWFLIFIGVSGLVATCIKASIFKPIKPNNYLSINTDLNTVCI